MENENKNEVVRIYVDRASEYIEITDKNGETKSYSNEDAEITFERDERPVEEILRERVE